MNLYKASQLAKLQSHVDKETGEIDIDAFNSAEIALQDKQQAVVAYLKNETISISMIDAAIKELTARKKSMQARHDNLKEYLLVNMQHHKISEITAPDHTFTAKIKKNPHKLIIDDENSIDEKYKHEVVTTTVEIDNKSIKDDLKAGAEISWAHLEQGERLEIK